MAVCHMTEIFHQHRPVLLHEVSDHLITNPDGIYVDATFGRGSHTRAILARLSSQGRLFAFDRDPEAVAYAQSYFLHDKRFNIFHRPFSCLQACLASLNVMGQVQGILFDLGVSSPQLDNPERGFSFSRAGKLDMRMDVTQGIDAKTWLANIEEKALADILWRYGEEKFSRRIARAIVHARQHQAIETTTQLADIIVRAVPHQNKKNKFADKHPATRSFQAIRIAINEELQELQLGLVQSVAALATGGRIGVISFHSLEDRLVKQFFRLQASGPIIPRGLPVKGETSKAILKIIAKPIKPSLQEIHENPRARSAIFRIAEKLP